MSGLFTQPPVDPDAPGIGRTTLVTTWVFTSLAIVAVTLRFWLRKKFFNWNCDDWIMLAAVGIQIVYQAFITLSVNWGAGKAFENITLEQFMEMQKWQFFAITPAQIVSVVARVSIVILLSRIFGVTRQWFKWFLIGFTTLQGIVATLGLVFLWVEKMPVSTHWNPMEVPTWLLDKRLNQYTSTGLQFLFAFSDLAYVILPVLFIYKVQMPRARKIGLIILLSLSVLTAGACIAKIAIILLGLTNQLPTSFGPDFGGIVFLTSSIEQSMVIIMGCIPTMGPLAKIQYAAVFTAIGDSIVSLMGSRRGSQRGSGNRSSMYRDDVELGQQQGSTSKIRASDEASGHSGGADSVPSKQEAPSPGVGEKFRPGIEEYSVTASAQESHHNLAPGRGNGAGFIRRDDTFGVTYDRNSGSR
ncbi:hypothetical protein V8F33_013093 [Rhypophila sp. PSN 637]